MNGRSQPYPQGPCLTAKGCYSYPRLYCDYQARQKAPAETPLMEQTEGQKFPSASCK